jgi:hypothetical protein
MYSGFLCHVRSNQLEFMALFMVFNFLIGPGLILSLVVNFYFVSSHFPVATLGLDLFSCAYLNKLLFLWFPVNGNSSF